MADALAANDSDKAEQHQDELEALALEDARLAGKITAAGNGIETRRQELSQLKADFRTATNSHMRAGLDANMEDYRQAAAGALQQYMGALHMQLGIRPNGQAIMDKLIRDNGQTQSIGGTNALFVVTLT